MPDDPDIELPEALRRELAALGSDPNADPPDAVEEAVVARLRAQGLLRSPTMAATQRRRSPALMTAAAVLLLTVGVSLGRASVPAPTPAPTHILLLHGFSRAGSQPTDESMIRKTYAAWAASPQVGGAIVGGEELGNDRTRLGSETGFAATGTSADDQDVVGYFLIRASSTSEAVAIARQCPHLRFGGTVELRPIVKQ